MDTPGLPTQSLEASGAPRFKDAAAWSSKGPTHTLPFLLGLWWGLYAQWYPRQLTQRALDRLPIQITAALQLGNPGRNTFPGPVLCKISSDPIRPWKAATSRSLSFVLVSPNPTDTCPFLLPLERSGQGLARDPEDLSVSGCRTRIHCSPHDGAPGGEFREAGSLGLTRGGTSAQWLVSNPCTFSFPVPASGSAPAVVPACPLH